MTRSTRSRIRGKSNNIHSTIIKLGDVHDDMERYLAHDCYCPNEVYDRAGFSYFLFPVDTDCMVIEQSQDMTAVVCVGHDKEQWSDSHIVIFWHDDVEGDNPEHKIVHAEWVDATDNNIGIARDIVRGVKPDGRKIDEYEPGSMERQMRQLMSLGGVVISD